MSAPLAPELCQKGASTWLHHDCDLAGVCRRCGHRMVLPSLRGTQPTQVQPVQGNRKNADI